MHILGRVRDFVISLVLLSTLLVSGCGTSGLNGLIPGGGVQSRTLSQIPLSSRHLDLVIADLVSGMVQVAELAPFTTTLQVSQPRGEFGTKLLTVLESAGYGLQLVTADQGVNYLSYANRVTISEIGRITDFVVSVGGISLRREYDLRQERVIPASVMFVKGSRSLRNITLDGEIFQQQGGNLVFDNGVELQSGDNTILEAQLRDIAEQSGNRSSVQEASITRIRNNVFAGSNFTSESDEVVYQPLRRVELAFADTTLKLGRGNKKAVARLVEGYQPDTDVFYLVSCPVTIMDSTNPQDVQLPSEKRSTRVKEELMLRGIPGDAVIEEGCVSSEYTDSEVSERAVVVIQRRKEQTSFTTASLRLPKAFPNRPLVMTIPYGVGGATDFQARIVTMLSGQPDMLGQPVLIVNKPGQGGQSGWSWFVDNAGISGYDLSTYNVPHFIAQSIKFDTSYNIDTLEPIANWGADPAVLVVPANSPLKKLKDYVVYAKQNPGKITVSGAGLYVGHHIAMLQLQRAAGIELEYAPTTGGAKAMKQVIDGTVMSGFNNMSDAFRQRDKLRILAIADYRRHSFLPDVSTFWEQGVKVDNSSVNFRGIMVPKGTDPVLINELEKKALKMFKAPGVVKRLAEGGSPLKVMPRAQVLRMWKERQAYLTKLLKGL